MSKPPPRKKDAPGFKDDLAQSLTAEEALRPQPNHDDDHRTTSDDDNLCHRSAPVPSVAEAASGSSPNEPPDKYEQDAPTFKDQVNERHPVQRRTDELLSNPRTTDNVEKETGGGDIETVDGGISVPTVLAEAVDATNAVVVEGKRSLVLFVDDNPENIIEEVAYLKRQGYSVITTTSTPSALTLLENVKVDVIVSDMGRTEDDDATSETGEFSYNAVAGLELIRDIRKVDHETPIFIYTNGFGESRFGNEAIQAGGNGVFTNNHDLLTAVANIAPMASVEQIT